MSIFQKARACRSAPPPSTDVAIVAGDARELVKSVETPRRADPPLTTIMMAGAPDGRPRGGCFLNPEQRFSPAEARMLHLQSRAFLEVSSQSGILVRRSASAITSNPAGYAGENRAVRTS